MSILDSAKTKWNRQLIFYYLSRLSFAVIIRIG